MIRPPAFWRSGGIAARLLAPFRGITRRITERRVARPGWHAPVPVICCGNATVGGTGKTPVCLDIIARLRARGIDVHALTRGFGGAVGQVTQVNPAAHIAREVGDEALLLARLAPTWVATNRAAAAQAAIRDGAQALVMDDGLQNASLAKTCSLLIIDGAAGFGNGHLLPAGPLREPVESAARRCRAAVMIGPDTSGAAAMLPATLPILHASLVPASEMSARAGKRVVAFAGIGRPEKFFDSLEQAGLQVCARAAFADHHVYRRRELARLRQQAASAHAELVTTWKDYMRLSLSDREGIAALGITLAWQDPAALEALLAEAVP